MEETGPRPVSVICLQLSPEGLTSNGIFLLFHHQKSPDRFRALSFLGKQQMNFQLQRTSLTISVLCLQQAAPLVGLLLLRVNGGDVGPEERLSLLSTVVI